jgi:ribosomal protein S27AE
MENPTAEYESLTDAFRFFNRRLFDDRLPLVLLTLSKHGSSFGYYRNRVFGSRVEQNRATDEIALCANTFRGRTDKDVLSTLVHEMAHLWHFSFGKRISRRGYHNLEWAKQMLQVGLHPSDTGKPGGKMYGHRMTHYVIEGGPFDRTAEELMNGGWRLGWEQRTSRDFIPPELSVPEFEFESRPTRKKFTCKRCQLAAWTKFSARLVCGDCGLLMI